MTDTTTISDFHQVCLQHKIPFVSYRFPQQEEITNLVQYTSVPQAVSDWESILGKKGFVISPFNEKNEGAFLLEPDMEFSSTHIPLSLVRSLSEISTFFDTKSINNDCEDTKEDDFEQQVELAKQAMREGKFDKVVLSRVKTETLSSYFNATSFFLKLCAQYPHAFVYFLQLPEVGCWIGASPEPLLLASEGIMQTVSLAGTQTVDDEDATIQWEQKETEEQGIVTNYIKDLLESFKVDNYEVKGPVSAQAANLVHLKTTFEFAQNEIENTGAFLQALHPTPSVCGLPKAAAYDFIVNHEQHNRAYYSGFLGVLNGEDDTQLYVNLRCLQLMDEQALLYSGAGITLSSDAKKEWNETDHKLSTLLQVLHQ